MVDIYAHTHTYTYTHTHTYIYIYIVVHATVVGSGHLPVVPPFVWLAVIMVTVLGPIPVRVMQALLALLVLHPFVILRVD